MHVCYIVITSYFGYLGLYVFVSTQTPNLVLIDSVEMDVLYARGKMLLHSLLCDALRKATINHLPFPLFSHTRKEYRR